MREVNVGKIMSILRQPVTRAQDQNGTRTRHRIASDRNEGKKAVFSRLPGALLRATLVVLLIVLPTVILGIESTQTLQVVGLVAIFAALFTLVEYSAVSPSLVEFRSAPPFNRLRFVSLAFTVLALSFVCRGSEESTIGQIFQAIGARVGASIDFPFSPVRLILLMLPEDATVAHLTLVRTTAGLSYLISLLSIGFFIILLRLRGWPQHNGAFNVWVNLPTFDPTVGGDVVNRLNRDSQVNLILGFLLPFIVPAAGKLYAILIGPISLADPLTLVWVVTAWAFLPASLLMRGVALSRVAQMIHVQRKRAYAKAAADGLLPA